MNINDLTIVKATDRAPSQDRPFFYVVKGSNLILDNGCGKLIITFDSEYADLQQVVHTIFEPGTYGDMFRDFLCSNYVHEYGLTYRDDLLCNLSVNAITDILQDVMNIIQSEMSSYNTKTAQEAFVEFWLLKDILCEKTNGKREVVLDLRNFELVLL